VAATYPDLRKCLNLLQSNSKNAVLLNPKDADSSTQDYKLVMVDLFKRRKIKEARKLLCEQARPEEMDEIFRWSYDNLDLWSKTDEGQDEAILIIRKGMINHSLAGDPEINLSAMIVELSQIAQ
jgi:replication factor C small subunit